MLFVSSKWLASLRAQMSTCLSFDPLDENGKIFLTSPFFFSIRSFAVRGSGVREGGVREGGVRGGTLSNGCAWFFDEVEWNGEGYRW